MTLDLTRIVAPLVWRAFYGGNMRARCEVSGTFFHASSEEDMVASDALNARRVVAALDPSALDRLIAEAVAAERERCAKMCDRIAGNTKDFIAETRRAAGMCAAAIRGQS